MNFKLSDLTWAGWLLLVPTVALIIYAAIMLGSWAATVLPERVAQAGRVLLAFVAVGLGLLFFAVGVALLRYVGIAVVQKGDE